MQSLVSEETKLTSSRPTEAKKVVLVGLLIFALTLSLTLAFHFAALPPQRTLCFDARQYFSDTAHITEFILSALHGHWQPQLLSEAGFLTSILSDGPALPTFYAVLFACSGHVPAIQDCKLIEIFQTVLHSFSALLVYGLTFSLTRRIVPAGSAGIVWGLYPAAIFWSGVFYTETTVIFFSLLFLACLSMSRRLAAGFAAGLCAGMVALLKPALLPAAAVASLLGYRLSKRSLILLILGTAVTLAPWAIYTKVLTGHARITAQRFPAFNLAMGSDTEVDACLVSPAPPLTTMFSHDDDMPLAFPISQWQYHTMDCLRLSAVKLSALWSRPANDFRQNFFGIEPDIQNIWHLFLLFSGISGILSFLLSCRSSKFSGVGQTIAWAALIFILSHFCYILFTPAARYGLTAMPFMVIFAAFAWLQIFQDTAVKNRIKFGLCAIASALVVLGLVNASSLSNIFRPDEIVHRLNPGDTAIKLIDLHSITAPQSVYSVLLLVDGNNAVENADLELNGHPLAGHLQHIRSFDSTLYLQSFELRSLGYPAGISTDAFRHWRAILLPPAWINWSGRNEIKLKAGQMPAVIYGEPALNRHMLAIDSFSVNSLCNSDKSLDLRIPSPILTGNISSSSLLKQHQSNNDTPIKDSLRIRLAVALGKPFQAAKLSSAPLYATEVSPKKFDLYMQDPTVNGVRTNRINMKAARAMGTTIDLPEICAAGMLRVHVEGDLRGTQAGKAEVVVALQPGQYNPTLVLNMSPESIEYNKAWRHFVIEDLVPTRLLSPGKKQSLYIAVYPGPWLDYCGYVADKHCGDAQFRNIKFSLSPEDRPDIANRQILFY